MNSVTRAAWDDGVEDGERHEGAEVDEEDDLAEPQRHLREPPGSNSNDRFARIFPIQFS